MTNTASLEPDSQMFILKCVLNMSCPGSPAVLPQKSSKMLLSFTVARVSGFNVTVRR